MATPTDISKLSELSAPDRAFLSVYLSGPQSTRKLQARLDRLRRALHGNGAEKDEREYFDENVKIIWKHLEKQPLESGSLCLFSCWALDFFKAVALPVEIKDGIFIDSSPFIRPLAEFQDEYENVAVVVADNKKASVYVVSSGVSESEETIKGNVKNHVRKGGWSQQRYERRRDKQLLHYARDIIEALERLGKQEAFRRIMLVGSKETLRVIRENLPAQFEDMVMQKAVDLSRGEGALNEDIQELCEQRERFSEQRLWDRIRAEYLRGGLGIVGLSDVLNAVRAGRVESMIVDRSYTPKGRRCRKCETLALGVGESCPSCGSDSVFEVGMVNEIVELLKQSGGEVDFADPIDSLIECGEIAALLRY